MENFEQNEPYWPPTGAHEILNVLLVSIYRGDVDFVAVIGGAPRPPPPLDPLVI